MPKSKIDNYNFFLRLHPLQRAGISLVIAVLTYIVLENLHISALLQITISWLLFSLSYLIMSWIVLLKRPIPEIRKKAVSDDGNVTFVFVMVLLSSFASMVLLLMISKQHSENSWLSIPVSIGGVLLSWSMVHTVYSFHYAHKYYNNDETSIPEAAFGLVMAHTIVVVSIIFLGARFIVASGAGAEGFGIPLAHTKEAMAYGSQVQKNLPKLFSNKTLSNALRSQIPKSAKPYKN